MYIYIYYIIYILSLEFLNHKKQISNIFSRIFDKHNLRENMFSAKKSTSHCDTVSGNERMIGLW